MATEPGEAVWIETHREISIVELAESSGLGEARLRELVEFGALVPCDPHAPDWRFRADCLVKARTAARLLNDLELETSAAALVLSFLDRIEALEARVRQLQAQIAIPHR